MVRVERGMLVRVKPWFRSGHEHDGHHPVLVLSRGSVGSPPSVLVVPVTSPSKEHEGYWDVNLSGLQSCALPSGLRTVPVSDLRSPGKKLSSAGHGKVDEPDLDMVAVAVRSLLNRGAVSADSVCPQGTVFSTRNPLHGNDAGCWMVLRYDVGNGVAMVMRIGRFHSRTVPLEVPILTDPGLVGRRLLAWNVREMSLEHWRVKEVGLVGGRDLERAKEYLMALAGS